MRKLREEPVVAAGGIASAIVFLAGSFVAMMVQLDVWMLSGEQMESINAFVLALVALGVVLAPTVAALFARKESTSLERPRDKDHMPLVRLDGATLISKKRRRG